MSDVIEYKCPACGGKLEFNSGSQKMRCPFCESEFDVDSIKDHDNCLEHIKEDDMEWETSAGSEWQSGEKENMLSERRLPLTAYIPANPAVAR